MPNYILSNTASQINTVLSQANTNINRNLFDFGAFSSIAGGDANQIGGSYSFIAGGSGNYSNGAFSNIFGGLSNQALAPFSNIIGRRSIVSGSHSGAMVMSDGQNRDHVSKGEHTLHLDFASGVYVNNVKIEQLGGGGGGGDIITNKTIYVDPSVGTDTRTSLSRYNMSKPFTTISGAAAASATGDLIYVRAGTYAINSQINLNNEGSLYFEPGATVNITNNVTGFSFNQATNIFPVANSIRIQGHADFVLTGSAGILTIPDSINTSSPPIVAFECNSITGPNAANGTLFNIEKGVLSVDAKTIAMTTTFTASNATVFNITGTGDVTTRIPFVYCGRFVNGSGTAFTGGARAQINADVWTLATYNTTAGMSLRLITTNFRIVNYNHVGVGAALSWTENTTFEGHAFRGITWTSLAGQPNITFASTAGSTTNKIIRLDQTNIMRGATTNSLSSNVFINVGTYGTFASRPATSNITFKIGSFTVDADVNTY
jgi:hypothetical protein